MTTIELRPTVAPMSAGLRRQFERDGFLVIRGALNSGEVDFYRDALDRVYASRVAAGIVKPGMAMHQLNAGEGQIVGDHQWGHYPDTTPLYGYLKERNLLDPSYPPLIP